MWCQKDWRIIETKYYCLNKCLHSFSHFVWKTSRPHRWKKNLKILFAILDIGLFIKHRGGTRWLHERFWTKRTPARDEKMMVEEEITPHTPLSVQAAFTLSLYIFPPNGTRSFCCKLQAFGVAQPLMAKDWFVDFSATREISRANLCKYGNHFCMGNCGIGAGSHMQVQLRSIVLHVQIKQHWTS